jgi:mRNA interferase MazF
LKIDRGTVVKVALDPTLGHEQRGARPCIVVSDPAVSEDQRYPMLCVVPLTGTPGVGALYPNLSPGESGLRKPSTAMVDQLRAVDKRRVVEIFGVIHVEEMAAIDEALTLFLDLQKKVPGTHL